MSFFPRDLGTPSPSPGSLVEWEETDCLLCGGGNWAPVVEGQDTAAGGTGLWFAVVQCKDCGLCFTNPRPSRNTIIQFYPSLYEPHRPTAVPRSRWWRRLPPFARYPRNERQSLSLHGQGRLLDFGCGGGVFLARMQSQGWQVTGLDISAAAVQCARSRASLRVLAGSLPHPELAEGSFDVVTMWHSLEHVHDPLEVLRAAHALLAPGGKLIAAAPNIDSWPFRCFHGSWAGLDLPRHLTHFTPYTLRSMLERAGFAPGPVRMVRHSSWLRSSARRACAQSEGPLWLRWLCRKPPSQLATWYSYLTRQADCIMVTALKERSESRQQKAG